jgi:hypothetical protein
VPFTVGILDASKSRLLEKFDDTTIGSFLPDWPGQHTYLAELARGRPWHAWHDRVAGCLHQPRRLGPWKYGSLGNLDGFQRLAPRQRAIVYKIAARGVE